MIKIGSIVTLRGMTQKGKSRIHEHGDKWKAISANGDKTLLESVSTKYLKWLSDDFKVIDE